MKFYNAALNTVTEHNVRDLVREHDENVFDFFRAYIGTGLLQTVQLENGNVAYVDEEGLIKGSPENKQVELHSKYGEKVILQDEDGKEYTLKEVSDKNLDLRKMRVAGTVPNKRSLHPVGNAIEFDEEEWSILCEV
jgi:hypothetical protein